MNTKQILAVGLSIALIIIAAAAYKLITLPSKIEADSKNGLKNFADACSVVAKSLHANIDSSSYQNDCLEVKPIIEMSFSKIRVRSIVKYERSFMNSSKLMIAHQAFDVRMGWSMEDNMKLVLLTNLNERTVKIFAPPPHRLTITKVEDSPVILFREDGMVNKLTPEDGMEMSRQLEQEALGSADLKAGEIVAEDEFEKFLRGLFQLQGLNVMIYYSNTNQPQLNLRTNGRDGLGHTDTLLN